MFGSGTLHSGTAMKGRARTVRRQFLEYLFIYLFNNPFDLRCTPTWIPCVCAWPADPQPARALMDALGLSQPTLSRRLAGLGSEVVRIGSATSIQYALRDTLRGGGCPTWLFTAWMPPAT